ncbi:MAG: hypothetical protein MPW17_05290 [Candidatus Manganitrophus sp.]|nr:hypothetical protein [Candidatus Manganitrophus sp.]MDC4226574.1 hypothetical protein [Candidatus Manganitrophus sp.]WDT72251.1 MAG: hypothetical protein MPW17_05290 [Candidatus Manganitrophus sp.]WDT75504.1 MAG: hypothetical protein MPW16_19820 [Candidatus Manganitrophus sp.]
MNGAIDPEDPKHLSPQGRCPFCRYRIYIEEEGGAVVIKAAIIKAFLKEGRVCAKCPKCKNWLIVPLQYRFGEGAGGEAAS